MRLQAADIDWSALDERERWTLEHVIPLVDEGLSYGEIADQLAAGDAKRIESDVDRLAAKIMALSGAIELPPLNDEEYEALKQSIADYGQQMPILRGSPTSELPGEIVDGRHRRRICAQLGIEPRYRDVDGTADQLRSLGLVLNLARRHMSTSSRRGIVRAKLLADPTASDRSIAAAIGVSHPTVAAVRRELELAGEVERSSTRTGTDGVAQRVRDRGTPPPPEHRSIRLLIPNELFERYTDGWISCSAFRLLERKPGVHELQVQLLDPTPATPDQLEQVDAYIDDLALRIGRHRDEVAEEMLRTASDVFGRKLIRTSELTVDEGAWLIARIAAMGEGVPA